MSNEPHPQNNTAPKTVSFAETFDFGDRCEARATSDTNFGHFGQERARLKRDTNVSVSMAITQSDHSDARRVELTDEIEIGQAVDGLPDGAICEVTFRGKPGAFTIEIRFVGKRWIVEGSGSTAELTGVFGAEDATKPERVPGWMHKVLASMDVTEVSVQR